MKKFIAALMTVLFLGSTGLVLADEAAAPATAPVTKVSHKSHKKSKKMKKSKPAPVAASTTPTAK